MVYLDPTHCSAPSWLVSSVGRAHRHRRGHGFKSRTGMNFFQVLFLTTTSAVFLAARISQLRFFTAVQIYEFHISKVVSFASIFYIFALYYSGVYHSALCAFCLFPYMVRWRNSGTIKHLWYPRHIKTICRARGKHIYIYCKQKDKTLISYPARKLSKTSEVCFCVFFFARGNSRKTLKLTKQRDEAPLVSHLLT